MKKSVLDKFLAAATVGSLLIATAGCAASAKEAPSASASEKTFVMMDANKDGKIILEEFKAANPNLSEQAFIIIDKNGDKSIDMSEWSEFAKMHAKSSREKGAPMNNIPGDPLIPPPDSSDLPLMRPPMN